MTEENTSWRILPIADVMAPMVEKLGAMAEKTRLFSEQMHKDMETMEKSKCLIHGIPLPINEDLTFSDSWWAKKTVIRYLACPECEKEKNAFFVNEKFKRMGIPAKAVNATFDNFDTGMDPLKIKALKKAKAQAQAGKGFLILRGFVGTGKTHLASAILKQQGGLFVTLSDLIGELRKTYADGGQEEMVHKYRAVKCLVLDELSEEVHGTDIPGLLYRIFADRYDKGRLTIITSNEPIEKIKQIMGERLTDRMRENYKVAVMEWKSYREPVDA